MPEPGTSDGAWLLAVDACLCAGFEHCSVCRCEADPSRCDIWAGEDVPATPVLLCDRCRGKGQQIERLLEQRYQAPPPRA
jgi:hypothetical protein